ncbi:MAG: glycosyltransferase family 39 protein [Sedimentisphaerales bacterium]|nr:glycosyltransferase family 39 protein [Sedimentisphaerales bacterium]
MASVTLVIYFQVHSFKSTSFDDPIYVYNNPNVQAPITLESVKWALAAGRAANWHPLTWLSHMLDWQLFGSNPQGPHLVNLFFHIANALLLFIVFKQMTHKLWQSAFVAALFALHPLHVESVAWIAERKDVLSTFFWILTMLAYVRFTKKPNITSYLPIIIFFALGLMSKPMLVTLPFVLLLLDYWPLERISLKDNSKRSLSHLLIEKIPLFLMTLASCIVTYIVQQQAGAVRSGEKLSFSIRLANVFTSYMKYIYKMIYPSRLAVFYPHPVQKVSIPYAIISAVILVIITIIFLRLASKRKYLFTGWLWYLGTLVPVIGLVQVGAQAIADRYTYITLTGLFIIIAWTATEITSKWKNKKIILTLASILIISALSICTFFQAGHWRNDLTLFQHTLDVTENNHVAHFSIVRPLLELGQTEAAVHHCSQAVQIQPDWAEAVNNLAWHLATSKGSKFYDPQKALQLARHACELTNYSKPEFLDTLAAACAATGDFKSAVETAQNALTMCREPEQKRLKVEIEKNLALYKAGKPYIEK